MTNNTYIPAKALVATVEREHYNDVAVMMVSAEAAEKLNLDAVKAEINGMYSGQCLTSNVEIIEQNTEEYKKKMREYMCPENEDAVDKLKKELIVSTNKNM